VQRADRPQSHADPFQRGTDRIGLDRPGFGRQRLAVKYQTMLLVRPQRTVQRGIAHRADEPFQVPGGFRHAKQCFIHRGIDATAQEGQELMPNEVPAELGVRVRGVRTPRKAGPAAEGLDFCAAALKQGSNQLCP